MKVVDDPTGRMDKTMDEMLITKNMLSTLSPTALPTLHPQPIKFDYNNNKWYYFKHNKNQNTPLTQR